jgi:hypothetical protein
MPKIPIKIKKAPLEKEVNDGLKVDLRLKDKDQSSMMSKVILWDKQKQPQRKRLFLAVLMVIILACLSYWFLKPVPEIPLAKIIPQETVAFSLIDQKTLTSQILPFHRNLQKQSSFYQWLITAINQYLNQANLDFSKDIQPLFEKQLGLVLFPSNDQTAFPFVVFLRKEAPSAQINRILDQIEQVLKKDFHFSDQIYRQIKIISLKPLSSPSSVYYYSQIENYLLISNSIDQLKKTIDLIIKQ